MHAYFERCKQFMTHRWRFILVAMGIAILIIIGIVAYHFITSGRNTVVDERQNSTANNDFSPIAGGKCKGEGAGTLTHLPMDYNDFAMILPYGLVAGAHVTPVDHQYYSPAAFNSPRDTYPVYAMADATLTSIEGGAQRHGDYRLVFSVSCTFFYYYDLVTSLDPTLRATYEAQADKQGFAGGLSIPVKAGQKIGKIGGQTLDFAVWDTTKKLTGFVSPKEYDVEAWKLYTADPLNYVTADVKKKMLNKYIRTAEPRSGKIDYDVDGRLIGNWFLEGTNGYAGRTGSEGPGYSSGHFSFAPEYIDPTAFIASFGDYQGISKQFSVPRTSPNPVDVSVATGLVKYELLPWQYHLGDGRSEWDRTSFPASLPLTLYNDGFQPDGCALFQLLEKRMLKLETVPGKSCSAISGFTSAAKLYTR